MGNFYPSAGILWRYIVGPTCGEKLVFHIPKYCLCHSYEACTLSTCWLLLWLEWTAVSTLRCMGNVYCSKAKSSFFLGPLISQLPCLAVMYSALTSKWYENSKILCRAYALSITKALQHYPLDCGQLHCFPKSSSHLIAFVTSLTGHSDCQQPLLC